MKLNSKAVLSLVSFVGLSLACVQLGEAQVINITNPNFTTDNSGWTSAFDPGVAGAYNATTNPYGSSQLTYGFQGGSTAVTGAPVATAGQLTMDASSVTDPGAPYPSTVTANFPQPDGTVRLVSSSGGLGSYYQNTGVVFAANTTYVLSAYTTGASTGPDYTGVGLSGSIPLTLNQVALNTNGFTTSTPEYSDFVSMQLVADSSKFQQETLTIDTASPEFSGLVGQKIVVNLLANNASFFGRAQDFTGVSLSSVVDVPEPSTVVMMLGGLILLLRIQRRMRRA